MIDRAHAATDRELAKMEKHLSKIYQRASKEIGESWKAYLAEVAAEIQPLQDAYDAAKEIGDKELMRKTGKELSAKKRERTLMDKHYKQMTEQLSHDLSTVNEKAVAYINSRLPSVYVLNLNEIGKEIESKVKGFSFELVDADTVKRLATTQKTLLPYKKIDGRKDVRWNTKRVNSEVLQGILQGERMDKIAARLSKVENMNEASAIRNARTSVTSAENRGRMDGFERAEDEGVDVKKQWVATLDDRTREAHGELDGVSIPLDESFSNSIGEIDYPGDPNADPENVYNCRCAIRGDVGQKKSESRVARDENGRSVLVENMTYSEWVKWREK